MSFAKLDSNIVDSSVWMEPDDVLRVWVAMLAKADRNGFVRVAVPAMAHLCRISVQRLDEIVDLLGSPDPYSRTKADEGRRLRPAEGGWQLVNYLAYRNSRDDDARREAQREWDRQNRPSGHKRQSGSPTQSDTVRQSRPNPTNAEAEAEEEKSKSIFADTDVSAPAADEKAGSRIGRPACPHQQIIALYHEVLPELRQVRQWSEARQKLLARRWAEDPDRQTLEWWRDYFGYVRLSKFLMGQVTGRDGRAFDCDLEWLVKPSNFVKVLEGKYEDQAA